MKLSPTEECEQGKVHYLPHRVIFREEKITTKVRPMFDASSKSVGHSLNDCLYAGPNLLPKILLLLFYSEIVVMFDSKQVF